jgi:hypothetical protein
MRFSIVQNFFNLYSSNFRTFLLVLVDTLWSESHLDFIIRHPAINHLPRNLNEQAAQASSSAATTEKALGDILGHLTSGFGT